MLIQLVIIFLSWLVYVILTSLYKLDTINQSRVLKNYVVFICLLLILQSALRNIAIGADTYAYYNEFENVKDLDWDSIFYKFYQVYVLYDGKDAGYTLLQKIFQVISSNFQFYLFCIAVFFFSAFGKFIYQNIKSIRDAFIVLCIYQAIYYDFFSITGIRQTLATGLLLLSCNSIYKRKLIKFLVLCLLAMTIHKSAIIFIPFYWLANLKHPARYTKVAILALPLIFIFARPLAIYLTTFEFTSQYAMYAESTYETTGASNFILLMLIAAIFLFLFQKRFNKSSKYEIVQINAFNIALLLTPLAWIDPSLMRIVQYYSIFMPLVLSNIVNLAQIQLNINPRLSLLIIIIIFTAIILKHDAPYAFFWEQMELGANYY